MSAKYAFIDEFGSFGFKFEDEGCSTHFIITAIIVDKDDVQNLEVSVEKIRKENFQQSEMKSSKIGSNHKRRLKVIGQLKKLPFKVYCFVCDKTKIYEQSGLRYKQPFYKFLSNYLYQELRLAFPSLTIVADQLGDNEFIQSFSK